MPSMGEGERLFKSYHVAARFKGLSFDYEVTALSRDEALEESRYYLKELLGELINQEAEFDIEEITEPGQGTA